MREGWERDSERLARPRVGVAKLGMAGGGGRGEGGGGRVKLDQGVCGVRCVRFVGCGNLIVCKGQVEVIFSSSALIITPSTSSSSQIPLFVFITIARLLHYLRNQTPHTAHIWGKLTG